jgi:hypothetical protein
VICYREHVYTSDLSYPNGIAITQAAPVNGWTFYTNHCCREASANLANSSSTPVFIRSTMFNQGGSSPCSDNSPKFLAKPLSSIHAFKTTIVPHSFDDPDKDSLIYDMANPWSNYQVNAPFNLGYSAYSPFYTPNASNPAPSLNPRTGDMKLLVNTSGNYYYGIQVAAFDRCNYQLKSITYFEFFQSHFMTGGNTFPLISAPLGGGNTPTHIEMVDTVYAGALYQLPISASDPDSSNGLPQNIRFTAWGTQFDSSALGGSVNCGNPPCASVTPALPGTFSGNGTINFSWQTSCNHLDNCQVPTEYVFHFKMEDDFCPVRGQQNASLRLILKPAQLLSAPSLDSLDADFAGNVTLFWTAPPDPNGIFQAYCIYADTTGNGNYYLVDSLTNYSQNSYVHIGANANYLTISYQLKIYSGCGTASSGFSTGSNSLIASFVGLAETEASTKLQIASIFPNPNQGQFTLSIISKLSAPNVKLSISDLSGRVVHEEYLNLEAGTQNLPLDASLSPGIYMLSIGEQAGNLTSRLIIY